MRCLCLPLRPGPAGLELLTPDLPAGALEAVPDPGETPEAAAGRALARRGWQGALLGAGWAACPEGPPVALVAARLTSAVEPGGPWSAAMPAWLEPARPALASALARLHGRRPVCAVVGCRETSPRFTQRVQGQALAAGRAAARAGFTVLTGGLGGVMELAARGAREAGGLAVGILPGDDPRQANPAVELALPSGIGYARNYLTALGCDVMVALNGGRGTLEEICFALDFARPVLSWGSWGLAEVEPVEELDDPGLPEAIRVEGWLAARFAEVLLGRRATAGGRGGGPGADHRSDRLEAPAAGPGSP